MTPETRNCQNCKTDFIIEPEDFVFYDKIKVPPPTFCPECRIQRKIAFRNTHSLYKRKDSFTDKEMISIYSPDKDLVVIDHHDWWKDGWDPMDYGKDYDFSRPFFEQWKELRNRTPLQSLSNSKAKNSDYCNVAEESYDSYLVSASWRCERTMYSDSVHVIKDSLDLHVVYRAEFSYDNINCSDIYKVFYSYDAHSSTDSYFLYDCRGCTDCFMSSNLRNKSYVFRNQQLSKEEYKKRISDIDLGSFEEVLKLKAEFEQLKLKSTHRFAAIFNSYNTTGDNIEHAKNCKNCFNVTDNIEDCKNVFWGGMNAKEVFDSGPGVGDGQLMYESFDTGIAAFRNLFTSVVYNCIDVEYSFNCYNCTNCFGGIGLRNKKYCILNKQYTKEEYNELLPKIKQHMVDMPYLDKKGRLYRYGEFFPIELSPFCYNETVAQDYFPLNKDAALKNGFSWKDEEERNYDITIKAQDIPDNINDIDESILNQIIECAHRGGCDDRCTSAFKIMKDELTFCKRFNIPIPRMCYKCRHMERFRKRTPLKLWHRSCMKEGCQNKFETPYAPERPEKIYCESCYQKEVI